LIGDFEMKYLVVKYIAVEVPVEADSPEDADYVANCELMDVLQNYTWDEIDPLSIEEEAAE